MPDLQSTFPTQKDDLSEQGGGQTRDRKNRHVEGPRGPLLEFQGPLAALVDCRFRRASCVPVLGAAADHDGGAGLAAERGLEEHRELGVAEGHAGQLLPLPGAALALPQLLLLYFCQIIVRFFVVMKLSSTEK